MAYYKITEKETPPDAQGNAGTRIQHAVQQVLSDTELKTMRGINTLLVDFEQDQAKQLGSALPNLIMELHVPFGSEVETPAAE